MIKRERQIVFLITSVIGMKIIKCTKLKYLLWIYLLFRGEKAMQTTVEENKEGDHGLALLSTLLLTGLACWLQHRRRD